MLLDSTALIDLQRGYKPARDAFRKKLIGQSASIITKLEIAKGADNKRSMNKILKLLDQMQIKFLPITPIISEKAEELFINYYHSKGIGIRDAFIAATALIHNEKLATRNKKHFDFISNLKLIQPY